MRKLTDFIVKKRYFFVTMFSLLAVISIFLSSKVTINEDIMAYLPKTSETRIGKTIMDENFNKQDTSILNVMFKNLSDTEKESTLKSLEKIAGVNSVDYENTKDYNKNEYTLYVLNVNDYADSETATDVYEYVKDNYKIEAMSGSIYDENKPLLQVWVVAIAITSAIIILIILSDSYIEPFLYLISIGIAVFINKGTNIMFASVSSITNSIVAILQLALSMDYSIMLSNRYKQEKTNALDKIEAMKEALYHSFKSISSSSVTTIVGLLALVFMSFTIGKDLGFVLAKGVLLSLLSIFFCLPALLLIFDDLINKTHKKSPHFNLTKLGEFIYKTRYLPIFLIVIMFGVTYFIKGNITVLYTGSEQDKVGEVFKDTNQIAIVYPNKYENMIIEFCKDLESDKKIQKVLCYSNTINEKLTFDKLNNKLQDLGQTTEIDEDLLKIIYYNYYNKRVTNEMTLNEFITFIQNDIYNNEKIDVEIDKNIKNNLNMLAKFTTPSEINKKRSIKDIAETLGLSEKDASNILIYYNSKNLQTKMTLSQFVDFLLNDISKDKEYSKNISAEMLAKMKKLQNFTDSTKINSKMNAKELANILDIDEDLIEQLFLFYRTTLKSTSMMTINEFASIALSLSTDDAYADMFDEATKKSLNLLVTLSNEKRVSEELDQSSMKEILKSLDFNVDDNTVLLLYTLYTGTTTDTKMTLGTFADTALALSSNDTYKNYLDEKTIASLQMIKSLISYRNTELPNDSLYDMFSLTEEMRASLNYVFTEDINGTYTMTPATFVSTLLSNEEISSKLGEEELSALQTANNIMENAENNFQPNELAAVFNKDETLVNSVYGIYDYQQSNLKMISLQNLITFLFENRENTYLKNYLDSSDNHLELANLIVNNLHSEYKVKEMSEITNTNEDRVNMIYSVHDYHTLPTIMSPYEFVNFIVENKDNELLSKKITAIDELYLVQEVMNSTIEQKKHTASEMSNFLGTDKDKLSLLFSLYNSRYIRNNQTITLYNFVDFLIKNVIDNKNYSANFDSTKRAKLTTLNSIMNNSLKGTKYTSNEAFGILKVLADNLDKSLVELVYLYYGSDKQYDISWKMTIEEFINYLNNQIITDTKYEDFIDRDMVDEIKSSQKAIDKAKKLIVSNEYSRAVLNTKYPFEENDTYEFIESIKNKLDNKKDIYVVGNSPMAVEMSKTFNRELDKITILTMIFIFIVVAITFKDLIIPFVLVLIIQTAVYVTMSTISLSGGTVYFISLLIVQAILMGATIDYAIVYTAYYREARLTMNIKNSIISAYNKSIHTILSSSSILIIVTLVVARFASHIAAKICETISQGTFSAALLILFILPSILASFDKLICRKGYYRE